MSKKESVLQNQLKAVRTRLGLSQQDLATVAGIARQTIGGIEAGTYALSLSVALRLAKALGCSIDELFWLEDDRLTVDAVAGIGGALPAEGGAPVRVMLGQVGGQWVAYPLTGEQAFRQEMIPADGLAVRSDSEGKRLSVQLLDSPETLAPSVLLAGCTPALSLWARSAERWHPGLRVHWTHANSMAALRRLRDGHVHAAGVHLCDPATGEANAPFVRAVMGETPTVLVNLGVWEEGLVVACGNPKRLRRGADLAQPEVTLINREQGAGSRLLLDALLQEDDVPVAAVSGYGCAVSSHQEVAVEVASGSADAGVSTEAVAALYGLTFIPIRAVRYDLALRTESLELPSVRQLLDTLQHRWVRSQLAVLGGYDTSRTGEILT